MAFSVSLPEDAITPPPAFYCPISLELMTDPVTLSTGITYDRASIQSWLSAGNLTCPVSRQTLLPHPLFTPNHTLLRIIRSWCDAHALCDSSIALWNLHASALPLDGCVCVGKLCKEALFKLGLLPIPSEVNNAVSDEAELISREQATPLLISLISHYVAAACRQGELAEHICAEALSTLAILPLSAHDLSSLAHPAMLHYLSHVLHIADSHSRLSSACLLTRLISHHPAPKSFLQSLSPQFLCNLASSLLEFFKQSNPLRTTLTLDFLESLRVLFKVSRTTLSSLAEAQLAALVHAVMEQLLQAARQGSVPIAEKALCLLQVLSTCAEGRGAIASHAFAVPTIAKFLQRSSGDLALEAAVVVLWKVCRYSNEEKVRRQAMAACVPSKLVLLMQASQCKGRAKVKAACLVRLLIGGSKSKACSSCKKMNAVVHTNPKL